MVGKKQIAGSVTQKPPAGTGASRNSCIACQKRKIKCDRQLPSCTFCLSRGLDCVYTEPKQRGPKKGTFQSLQTEIKVLREMVSRGHGENREDHGKGGLSIGADVRPLGHVNSLVNNDWSGEHNGCFSHSNSIGIEQAGPGMNLSVQPGPGSAPDPRSGVLHNIRLKTPRVMYEQFMELYCDFFGLTRFVKEDLDKFMKFTRGGGVCFTGPRLQGLVFLSACLLGGCSLRQRQACAAIFQHCRELGKHEWASNTSEGVIAFCMLAHFALSIGDLAKACMYLQVCERMTAFLHKSRPGHVPIEYVDAVVTVQRIACYQGSAPPIPPIGSRKVAFLPFHRQLASQTEVEDDSNYHPDSYKDTHEPTSSTAFWRHGSIVWSNLVFSVLMRVRDLKAISADEASELQEMLEEALGMCSVRRLIPGKFSLCMPLLVQCLQCFIASLTSDASAAKVFASAAIVTLRTLPHISNTLPPFMCLPMLWVYATTVQHNPRLSDTVKAAILEIAWDRRSIGRALGGIEAGLKLRLGKDGVFVEADAGREVHVVNASVSCAPGEDMSLAHNVGDIALSSVVQPSVQQSDCSHAYLGSDASHDSKLSVSEASVAAPPSTLPANTVEEPRIAFQVLGSCLPRTLSDFSSVPQGIDTSDAWPNDNASVSGLSPRLELVASSTAPCAQWNGDDSGGTSALNEDDRGNILGVASSFCLEEGATTQSVLPSDEFSATASGLFDSNLSFDLWSD